MNYMNRPDKALIFCALIVAPLLANGQSKILFTEPVTLTDDSSRPLSDMLNRVQRLYNTPIDFEEVPYENPSEIRWSNMVTPKGVRPAFPVGGKLVVTLDKTDTNAYLATETVIAAYTSAELPGLYQAIEENGRIDVIPKYTRGVDGTMREVPPIMSESVTLPSAERTVFQTLELMSSAVSKASGFTVHIMAAGIPENAMTDVTANGEPARDVLASITSKLGITMAYQALYDPREKAYYVGLQPVALPTGAMTQRNAKPAIQAPTENPFWVKSK